MREFIFVMTHPGSNWEELVEHYNQLPNVEVFNTGRGYYHWDDVEALMKMPHKRNNAAAVWGDVILHNHQFTFDAICQRKNLFIFWHQPFDPNHKDWVTYGKYAKIYYDHREEGMRQYSLRCARILWNPPFPNS